MLEPNDWLTTVLDEGTNNKLIGKLARIHNSGAPEEVKAHLAEITEKKVAKMQQ